ncbi:MAG: triose-phosphate isomerase [Magnetococcales bacterium]|nr:triose-phosphate isomerase [Magnetococcales bacterium]MBF0439127.1 triose-phosphate isomerase [Magnetococcales bacterium]
MGRRTLIVGNWKMNGLIETAQEFADAILTGLSARAGRFVQCEVVICPPATALYVLNQRLGGSSVKLGGQNISEHESGPHTGEICGIMLRNVGCRFVILGHSERRATCGEDNETVGRKMAAAFRDGLQPIVCVGESLEERDLGRTLEVVEGQIEALIPYLPVHAAKRPLLVLAYEPVWAIGTGRNATPEQIQEVHGFIRQRLEGELGADAQKIRILYGGSVKGTNARSILALKDVDGGLIGGASLKAADFLAIIDAVPEKF